MGGNYKASRLKKTTGYDPGIPTPRLRLATLPPYEAKGLQEITNREAPDFTAIVSLVSSAKPAEPTPPK